MKLCLHISWHKRRRQLTFLLAFKPRNCPPTTPMGVTCSKPSSIKKENDDQPIYSLHFPSLCPQQFCTVVFTLGLLTFHFFMNAMIVGISILLFKSNILKHQNSCIAWISTLVALTVPFSQRPLGTQLWWNNLDLLLNCSRGEHSVGTMGVSVRRC